MQCQTDPEVGVWAGPQDWWLTEPARLCSVAEPRFWRTTAVAVGAAVGLSGCATNLAESSPPVIEIVTETETVTEPDTILQPPADGAWQSESLEGKHFFASEAVGFDLTTGNPENQKIFVDFTDDGQVGIFTGCNNMGGPVAFDGNTLVVPELEQTMMLCENWTGDAENWVSALIRSNPTVTVSAIPASDAGRVGVVLENPETGDRLQLEQWFPLDIAVLGAWGIPEDYSEADIARINEEPFHLLVGESDNCMILENNETGERFLPLWQNPNLAKGIVVGEDIVVTGEGPFDTLPARMPLQEESLVIPANCPKDIPKWVVWDRIR